VRVIREGVEAVDPQTHHLNPTHLQTLPVTQSAAAIPKAQIAIHPQDQVMSHQVSIQKGERSHRESRSRRGSDY
jgi:hypothetical protein